MSRIGKHPVPIPAGVDVQVSGQDVAIKGKLGALTTKIVDDVTVAHADGKISVQPRGESKRSRQMWATSRTLVANMVKGVSEGYTVNLEINGVGYRAAVQGSDLVMQLGFSHDVKYPIPEGIAIKCDKPTAIAISGIDKQKVGQVAAEIRGWKKPEPYKGKGIKYANETILRKEGKKK